MSLPLFQGPDKNLNLLQNTWAALINPVLNRPQNKSVILTSVPLIAGTSGNIINHGLNRRLQGWRMVRIRASATFYDMQDTNKYPELTLILVSSAGTSAVPIVCDIEVF